jgi:hypothetical protein
MLQKVIDKITWRPLPFIVIIFFALSNSVIMLVSNPVTYPDSAGYILAGESISVPMGNGEVWTGPSSGTFSLFGNSIRSWPNLVFYSFVVGNDSRIILQSLFYIIGFALLTISIEITSKKNHSKFHWVHILNLILFLSPQILQWNNIILSESLTITLILFAVASLLFFLRRPTSTELFLVVLVLFGLISLIKLNFLFVLGFVIIILLKTKYDNKSSKRKMVSLSILCLLLVTYVVEVNRNISDTWGTGSRPSRNAINFFFLTAEGPSTPFGKFLRDNLPSNAPPCLRNNPADDSRPYSHAGEMASKCPDGVKWVNDNFINWYSNLIISNPSYALKYFKHYLPLVNSSAIYYSNSYVFIPHSFVHVYYVDNHVAHGFISTPIIGLFILLSMFLALPLNKGNKGYLIIIILLGLTAFLTLFSTMLLMTAEIQRIVAPSLTLLFLCLNLSLHFFNNSIIFDKKNSNKEHY